MKIAEVPRGSLWSHWKTGTIYRVLAIAFEEACGNVVVAYEPIDDPDEDAYTRPLHEWLGMGAHDTPRFKRLDGSGQ